MLRDRCLATALALALGACSTNTKFAVTPGAPEVTWSSGSRAAPASQSRVRQQPAEPRDEDLAHVEALYAEAVAQRQEGNLDEAARLYRQALALCESKQGPDSPAVASILNNLAGVEAAQGDYGEAVPLLERTVSIRQATLGEQDPATAQSMNNLALLYAARGDAELAEPLYRRSLAVLEKGNQASRADLEQVLENYAALLRDTGRDSEADEMEVRVRIIRAGRGAVPE